MSPSWTGRIGGLVPLGCLLLDGCQPATPPIEDPVATVVPPAPLQSAPPAPPVPEPSEYCDAEGWCRPYKVLPFSSAAATTEAVAIGGADGVVALWADGRWRGGFTTKRGTEVVALRREGDAIQVVTCAGKHCEQRTWREDGFGASATVPRPPAAPAIQKSRLGDWQIEYSSLIRGPLKLRPHTALAGVGCIRRFEMIGDDKNPFVLCVQYTSVSLHHVVGDELKNLVEPWYSNWVNEGERLYGGAGCEPCVITLDGILARNGSQWIVLPMSNRAAEATGGYPMEHVGSGLHAPELQIARVGEGIVLGAGNRVWTWKDGWVNGDYPGPWATPVAAFDWPAAGSEEKDANAYATADALMVVNGFLFKYRRWDSFLSDPVKATGFADVQAVAAGDVLHVRRGPHAASEAVADLAPDSRCVRLLDATSRLSGRSWQAVQLADGQRGWVNGRYLRAAAGCGPD